MRCFSQSTAYGAKGGAKVRRQAQAETNKAKSTSGSGTATTTSDGRPKPNPEDPFDFADVEYGWNKGSEHYTEQLKRMRGGGRYNPDVIGELRVRPDKNSAETFPLRELAAVVPKGGRSLGILVHEEALVKPVMSAIQSSPDFNQQPQISPDNELELVLRVDAESKDDLVKRAKETCHAWREQLRTERQKRDTVIKKWQKDKVITSDDKTKLDKELQKLQDQRMTLINNKEKEILQFIASKDGR
jgi:ribosome recycling factor